MWSVIRLVATPSNLDLVEMKLKRIDLKKEPFTSTALVIDEEIQDSKIGQMVALVSYSPGGNVIVFFKEGYDPLEICVAGEKYFGESMRAKRIKIFDAVVRKDED